MREEEDDDDDDDGGGGGGFSRKRDGQSGSLSLLDCLQGSKGSPVRRVCHAVCCGHLYIDFGQGQGPVNVPVAKNRICWGETLTGDRKRGFEADN